MIVARAGVDVEMGAVAHRHRPGRDRPAQVERRIGPCRCGVTDGDSGRAAVARHHFAHRVGRRRAAAARRRSPDRRAREPPSAKASTQRGPAARGSSVSLASLRPVDPRARPAGRRARTAPGRQARRCRALPRSGAATITTPDSVQNSIGTPTIQPSQMCHRRSVERSGAPRLHDQMWIGLPCTAIAASFSASAWVGCAWQV